MNWNAMTGIQKAAVIIAGIAAVIWGAFQVKPDLLSIDLTFPAVAAFTGCEGVFYWNEKRKWSYLLIAVAVISMIFFILELCLF